MKRDTESIFLGNLEITTRGQVKTAASQLPNGKEIVTYSNVMQDIERVLRAFDKSPEITHATIDIYKKRAGLGDNPKSVAQDFFKELIVQRANQTQMSLVTAMAYRQVGIFKVAGRDVYEDLETGDFWKISEDKKHVMRLFKEDDKGISDKKAACEEVCCEAEESEEKLDSEGKEKVLIPVLVQESAGGTRVIVDMSDVAEILEKRYNGVPKKTEIQMGEKDKVIFDLELKA
jgi:hypothetical protein